MRAVLVLLLVLLAVAPAHGRELWADAQGFRLDAAGWFEPPQGADWIGVKVGLTIPPNGYAVLDGRGVLELYLPCKGWVADTGIIAVDGCTPRPDTGRDTRGGALYVLTAEMGCDQQDGRVLMIVRLPHMFPTKDCRPTEARWVESKGYCHADDQ